MSANRDSGSVEIASVDRVGDGLIISYTTGQSFFYHGQFLYDVRADDGNRLLPNEPDNETETNSEPNREEGNQSR